MRNAADVSRGEWIDPRIGRTPFRDYAPVWMKSRLHKSGTVDTYEGHLRNHITPAFGSTGLAAIRPTMVQQWVKDLQAIKGLAPRTIETVYVIFASIMLGAVRDGYIRKTPCADIRLPEITKTPVRLLTPGQVLALAAATPQRYALLVLLGAAAGLRQGEAFGLALDRVDQAAGMITVNQQVIIVDRRPVLAPRKPLAHCVTCLCPGSCSTPLMNTPTGSGSMTAMSCAVPPGALSCAATTTTARSGSPR
jgi:integrase